MKTYIYANSEVLAQHDGPHTAAKYFYLHDRLGSVRQIINTSGLVQKYYTYEPFGQSIESGGTFADPFRFTGQFYDEEIAEYYLRARQYNPAIARFTARDPVFGKLEQPLTLHKYLYCGNDPINMLDIDGRWAMYFTFTAMVSLGISQLEQHGWVIDEHGNVGEMSLEHEYGYGTPYAFGGVSLGYSPNAKTIDDMGGTFISAGGAPIFGFLGAEAFWSPENNVYGIEVSVGGGPPIPEVHGHKTRTEIRKLNMNWRDALGKMEERLEKQWDDINTSIDLYTWAIGDTMVKFAYGRLASLKDFEEPGGR